MTRLLALIIGLSALQAPWDPRQPARVVFDSIDRFGPADELARSPLAATPGDMAWGESYLLSAYVTLYEATRDTRYLDRFAARFRVLLALRDDRQGKRDELRGRLIAAWGSTAYSGGKRTCWNVHAGMLTHPAARFARLVKERRSLRRYRRDAREFSAALAETIAAFDPEWRDGPNPDEGHYTEVTLAGKHLPLNQQNAMGRTLLDLGAATGNARYRQRAAKLAAFFKRRIRIREDGAAEWSYWPNLHEPYAQGAEDISHASINADFAVRCYQDRVVFTRQDIERMAATVLKVIFRPDGSVADNIAGAGGGQMAAQIGRWGELACVNRDVARAIRDFLYRQDPPAGGTTAMLALAILAKYGL